MTPAHPKKTLFIRALSAAPNAKAEALRAPDGQRYAVDSEVFRIIPNAPFAYWLTPGLREVFKKFPKLSEKYEAKQGLATADDFRFLRLWWETKAQKLGFSTEDTFNGQGWVHFAKGGSFGRFYSDIYLTLNWLNDGKELKIWAEIITRGEKWSKRLASREFYFRRGLTWPLRTSNLSFRSMPDGCIFGHKGPVVFHQSLNALKTLGAIASSEAFYQFVKPQTARTELAQSFETGIIQITPVLEPRDDQSSNAVDLFDEAFAVRRILDTATETSHAFRLPWLLQFPGDTLAARFTAYQAFMAQTEAELARLQHEIDELAFDLYELSEEDRAQIRAGVDAGAAAAMPDEDDPDAQAAPSDVEDEPEETAGADLGALGHALLSWCVGAAFGRWDVRMALDSTLIPALQGPFERLPVVAPAGLVGVDGYPAQGGLVAPAGWLRARPDVISLPDGAWENTSEYPLPVAWDGILVSDSGNPRDLAGRVRSVLALLFGARAEQIEEELLAAVRGSGRRPVDLEEYLAQPKFFFAGHLKGYSRSRRKAPVYWPLTHPDAAGFVVWLYAPALTAQSLAQVVTDVLLPRLDVARSEVARLEAARAETGSSAVAQGLERAEDFARGLEVLISELRRLVDAGYEPWPDDGTLLSAAPLHAVFPWKDLAPVFRAIQAGRYPWSHAHTLWATEVPAP